MTLVPSSSTLARSLPCTDCCLQLPFLPSDRPSPPFRSLLSLSLFSLSLSSLSLSSSMKPSPSFLFSRPLLRVIPQIHPLRSPSTEDSLAHSHSYTRVLILSFSIFPSTRSSSLHFPTTCQILVPFLSG